MYLSRSLILLANLVLIRLVAASLADVENDKVSLEQKLNHTLITENDSIKQSSSKHPQYSNLESNKESRSIIHQGFNFGKLLGNVLQQLEKVDLKRLMSDSLGQSSQSRIGLGEYIPANKRRKTNESEYHKSSADLNQQGNATSDAIRVARPKINGSAIVTETGNLLSITRQLVKLARNGFGATEFGPTGGAHMLGGSSPNWLGPLIAMPTMLGAAASHALHASADQSLDFGQHHHLAKSDWFWVVMPAIIAVGAGVIIVPLIAAWLVSGAMSQNTLTVAAGRRRRRRDTLGQSMDPLELKQTHSDIFQLLDLHSWLDDIAPEILISKLSRLHQALESVGTDLIGSTLNKQVRSNVQPNVKF